MHWNFFITLGCLPIFLYIVTRITSTPSHLAFIAVSILTTYEYMLHNGLREIILHSPRSTLLLMNKEGISSLVGYFSIFLLSVCVGVYTKTKSFIKPLIVLTGIFIITTQFLEPSRRLVRLKWIFIDLGECWICCLGINDKYMDVVWI